MATKKKWIQKATKKMEKKGTVGAFGKATSKKIKSAKKEGGIEKKRAVFAENMKKIAAKKKKKSSSSAYEKARKSHYKLK